MEIRFRETVAGPAWTIHAGSVMTIEGVTPQVQRWLGSGVAEVVRRIDGSDELAVVADAPERAVVPHRRSRRADVLAQ